MPSRKSNTSKTAGTSRRRLPFDAIDSSPGGGGDDGARKTSSKKSKQSAQRSNRAAATTTTTAAATTIVPPPSTPVKQRAAKQTKKRSGQLDLILDSPAAVPKKAKLVPTAASAAGATAVTVTPGQDEQAAERLSKYVPKYVHKNVEYLRKGEAKLKQNTIKVYQWICQHYVIPKDFEQKRLYGPLSGISYEERVIQAYSLGKLERIHVDDGDDDASPESGICTACAEEGHQRDDCPTLL